MLAPFSLTPVIDRNGKIVRTAALMAYQAGTTTPAVLYSQPDYASGTELPNPVPVNGAFILPAMYGKGSFKFRMLSSAAGGSILWEADGISLTDPVVGETGAPVDTTRVLTGSLIQFYGTGSRAGYVRANGRTIGNVASGASERAAEDTRALYLSLWIEDDSLLVATGRGLTATADFDAGKAMSLPDARGRVLWSMDSMGGGVTGTLAGAIWNAGGSATRLGSRSGVVTHQLTIPELPYHTIPVTASSDSVPNHQHSGTTDVVPAHAHSHGYTVGSAGSGSTNRTVSDLEPVAPANTTGTTSQSGSHSHNYTTSAAGAHSHAITVSVGNVGNDQPFSMLTPLMLVTTYIKL